MKISLNGLKEHVATFEATSQLKAGALVKISANGTVDTCGDTEKFAGVVLSCRGGFAAVQLGGYVVLPYTGTTAPVVGFQSLCGDGKGGVKAGSGRELLVTDVDTTAKTVGFLL